MKNHEDIIEIEDSISKDNQDLIESVFTDWTVNWAFNPSATVGYGENVFQPYKTTRSIESPCFTHTIVTDKQQLNPPYVMLFLPVLSAIPYSIDQVLRFKINCTMPNNLDKSLYGMPHVDLYSYQKEYLTAIYYINDSDGDTVLFDTFFDEEIKKINEIKTIEPKKGKLIIFNGNRLHAGNTPKEKNYRLTANINFTIYR